MQNPNGGITIRCPDELLADLDIIRAKEKDVPSRAEMIRRLIAERAALAKAGAR